MQPAMLTRTFCTQVNQLLAQSDGTAGLPGLDRH